MLQNALQFRIGLSEAHFADLQVTEDLYVAAVDRMRWPDGCVCPDCGYDDAHRLERRALLQCALCRSQVRVTAHKIFNLTKSPLTIWYRAMYHLMSSKNGVSARELSRRLGVSWRPAWLFKQKLSEVMRARETRRTFAEPIEIDDADLGDERPARKGHEG